MIIFLYGPDDYRRNGKKREIVAEFEKRHSAMGVGSFDFETEGDEERFREFVRSQSMFDAAKLAVSENMFAGDPAGDQGGIRELADKKTVTVLVSERKKPAKAFEYLLKKPVLSQQFEYLEGERGKRFIEAEAEKTGVSLALAAAEFLAEVYEGDSWALVTELQKIALLGKATVQKRDLENLDLELAPDFWQLLTGLKSQNRALRIASLERLFAANEPAGKLFNILAYQLPGRLETMAGYDLAVKSGKMDYEEALVDLLTS